MFLVGNEDCKHSYFFAPSIGKKKNIGGKIYYVKVKQRKTKINGNI